MATHLLGIRREDKNPFERRVPLSPFHVQSLIRSGQIQIALQPSDRRIFGDDAYLQAGASIDEDLSACKVIMGVKEIPVSTLLAEKVYVFFSHTIKGQPYNMPMLRRLMELGCTLIDYERIVDPQGRRLVFFGKHAGLAGMIDTLWALGQRLLEEGLNTPLASIKRAYHYESLEQAKQDIARVGQQIQDAGLPVELLPLVFGIAGYGNVSVGAQEILDLLSPRTIEPDDVVHLHAKEQGLFKVVFHEQHMVRPRAGAFELQDYYDHPDRYEGAFERFIDHLSVLVNCIYWDERYPRLITKQQLQTRYGSGQPKLRVIGDISCDVQGAIEATLRATEPDNPVFVYDVSKGQAIDGLLGRGPAIMAVDNLPAELPKESSEFFSEALSPFIPQLVQAEYSGPLERCKLPEPMRKAVIVYQGQLTTDYEYISQYL